MIYTGRVLVPGTVVQLNSDVFQVPQKVCSCERKTNYDIAHYCTTCQFNDNNMTSSRYVPCMNDIYSKHPRGHRTSVSSLHCTARHCQ